MKLKEIVCVRMNLKEGRQSGWGNWWWVGIRVEDFGDYGKDVFIVDTRRSKIWDSKIWELGGSSSTRARSGTRAFSIGILSTVARRRRFVQVLRELDPLLLGLHC